VSFPSIDKTGWLLLPGSLQARSTATAENVHQRVTSMKSLNRINLVLLFLTQVSLMGFAQSGVITTYVGAGLPVIGVRATTQAIDQPYGIAPDGTGGFNVASWVQNRV
jgi:hypothetical protein